MSLSVDHAEICVVDHAKTMISPALAAGGDKIAVGADRDHRIEQHQREQDHAAEQHGDARRQRQPPARRITIRPKAAMKTALPFSTQ